MVELKSTGKIYALKVVKKESMLEDEDNDWVQVEKNVFEIFIVDLTQFHFDNTIFYAATNNYELATFISYIVCRICRHFNAAQLFITWPFISHISFYKTR